MNRRLLVQRGLTSVLIVAAVMLMSHPFTGVRHDGTLYAGEALARLIPSEFRDDLYFLFGSQGRFTLLPTLYATLIAWFGLGAGTIVGMLIAFGLYLASATYLIGWFAPRQWRDACVLTVVLGWTIYGGDRIFAYSEPFLTARSLAEPAVLFGLGLLVRARWVAAVVVLLAALVIHPLVAAGGWLVAWIYLVLRDRRWIWPGLAALVVLCVLGWTRIGPFSDVFSRYDAQWLDLVHDANGHAFVLRWFAADYGVVFYDLVLLGFASHFAKEVPFRLFVRAVIAAGLGALFLSLLLVDGLDNPFFGKLQIWRALWIFQWVAMASLPLTLRALWQRGEHGRIAAMLLAVGWMAMFTVTPAFLAAGAVVLFLLERRVTLTRTTTRIVGALVLLAALSIVVQYEARVFKFGALLDQSFHQVVGQALAMNILLLVGALALLRGAPRIGWVAPIVALAAFVAATLTWDQRPAWTRALESYPLGVHVWPGLIEPEAKVYWYRDLIAPWVLLGHSNYYTQQQGSGAVFSRDMVVELEKRRKVTALLDFQEQICRMMNNLSEKQGSCEPDAEAVATVCREGRIDYIVLQSQLAGRQPTADLSTGVVENGYEKKFFLYRCSALNKG